MRLVLAPMLTLGLAGCLPPPSTHGGDGGQGGGSIVASVEGLAPEDRARETFSSLEFKLICKGGLTSTGRPDGAGSSAHIRFEAGHIPNGSLCALEIWDRTVRAADYNWFGKSKKPNGELEDKEHLKYASTYEAVKNRSLTLNLFILYQKKEPAAGERRYEVALKVEVDLAGAATLPAELGHVKLECDGTSISGKRYEREGDRIATLRFDVDVRDKRQCALVAAAVSDTDVYEHAFEPKLEIARLDGDGTTQTFPAGEGRYVLKKKEAALDPIKVHFPEGPRDCIRFIAEGADSEALSQCDDTRRVALDKLPGGDEGYLLVRVKGKKKGSSDAEATFLVGAGARGFGLYKGAELTTDALAAALRDRAQTFNWWAITADGNPRDAAFDAKIVEGTDVPGARAIAPGGDELKDFRPLHIEAVWAHGFHALESLDRLNERQGSLRWMVRLKVTKGERSGKLIVTDKTKYFHSEGPLLTVGERGAYFDRQAFVEKRALEGGRGWSLYAMKGDLLAADGCGADWDHYAKEMSRRHLGTLVPEGGDAKVDGCLLPRATLDAELPDATFELDGVWVWEWHRLH